MKLLIGLALALLCVNAAAVSIRSDPVQDERLTHCAWYLDSNERVLEPIATEPEGVYCLLDVSTISTGDHTVQAAFVIEGGAWGDQEGAKSIPFAFSRPAEVTEQPGGLGLQP